MEKLENEVLELQKINEREDKSFWYTVESILNPEVSY